jgi:hypothetical protein
MGNTNFLYDTRTPEQSAKEARALQSALVLYRELVWEEKSRLSYPKRNDKHAPRIPADGVIIQVNTLNQFHEDYCSISKVKRRGKIRK